VDGYRVRPGKSFGSLGALAAVCLALALLVGCAGPRAAPASSSPGAQAEAGAPVEAPARVQLKTAYTTASATSAPIWLAVESGAFTEQGIDVELTFIGAGQAILGSLSSQETPLVIAGANQAIDANLQGGQYVILGGAMSYVTTSVWVVPAIQRPGDLIGKTVGVSNFGAISHVALKIALNYWGLEEGRDVTVVRSGGTPETLAAMLSGAIHGGSFGLPQSVRARELGFRELLDVATLRYDLPTASVISTRAYVAQNPDLVERYLKALIRGVQVYKTDQNLAVDAIMRYGRIDERSSAEETWAYFRDLFSEDLILPPRGIENNLKLIAEDNPEALGARVEQFLDSSFVERIKASGYVERVKAGR
jgi:NitT/TauT family transport system substrate-binding protein